MPLFSKGVLRLPVVLAALVAFCLVPPEALGHGPNLCLWRHLFQVSACPACGSTRALAAFFHGRFSQAVSLNLNVLLTAPTLLVFLARDLWRLIAGGISHRSFPTCLLRADCIESRHLSE